MSRMTGSIAMWTLGSTKQAARHCCCLAPQSAVGTKDPANPGLSRPHNSLLFHVPRLFLVETFPGPAHEAVTGMNAHLFVINERGCGVLMKGACPQIGLTSLLQTNGASDAGRGFVRLWHRETQGALHRFASLGTATPTQLPWFPHSRFGKQQHEVHMPAQQSPEISVLAPTLPPPTLPASPDTNLFHLADISFTSSCQYFHRSNK